MVAKSESPVANYEAKHNTLGHTGTIDHGIFMGFCPSSTAGFRKHINHVNHVNHCVPSERFLLRVSEVALIT
jgi:hypothetical protein